MALLAVSEMSWAGPRAAKRAEFGERPFRLPTLGGWAWTLAPSRAGRTVKARAVDHIEQARRVLSSADVAAIRATGDAHPDMPPAELAVLLAMYGVTVDTTQVATVLAARPAQVTVDRPDAPDMHKVRELPPVTMAAAVVEAASALGPDADARAIADRILEDRRLVVDLPYVRTVLHRAKKQREMEGGYA
ncbi:hypothetical protein [Streptomyces albicerus]|uniref:hypothetical protein n=1 Tax=Streptomyces albicerus TaxID=2569859 RepID=UPI00124B0DB3|nr:hypothetical protein [Streptomyces albicerus]